MKSKAVMILLLVALLAALAGCWDLRELEDMALIVTIGIDKTPGEDQFTLTVEEALPLPAGGTTGGATTGGIGTGPHSVIYQASGRTLSLATGRLQQVLSRKLFLNYTNVIIIGEEAARTSMRQLLDFLDRNPRIRRSVLVTITPGQAWEVLHTAPPHTPTIFQYIAGLLENSPMSGAGFRSRIGDNLLEPLAIAGIEPIAAAVVPKHFAEISEQGEKGMGNPPGPDQTGSVTQVPGDYEVTGMAVFRDARLVGWLNLQESQGLRWVQGRMGKKRHAIVVSPRHQAGEAPVFTFRFTEGTSKIKTSLADGMPAVHLAIKAEGEIAEWTFSNKQVDPDLIKSLEDQIAAGVKNEVLAALEKAQRELGSDVFGFGYRFSRQHRREWNQGLKEIWPEIFPLVPVSIEVEAKILNVGTILTSLRKKPL